MYDFATDERLRVASARVVMVEGPSSATRPTFGSASICKFRGHGCRPALHQAPRRCDRSAQRMDRHDPSGRDGSWVLDESLQLGGFLPGPLQERVQLGRGDGQPLRTPLGARTVQVLSHVVHLLRSNVQAHAGAPVRWTEVLVPRSGGAGSGDGGLDEHEVVARAVSHESSLPSPVTPSVGAPRHRRRNPAGGRANYASSRGLLLRLSSASIVRRRIERPLTRTPNDLVESLNCRSGTRAVA